MTAGSFVLLRWRGFVQQLQVVLEHHFPKRLWTFGFLVVREQLLGLSKGSQGALPVSVEGPRLSEPDLKLHLLGTVLLKQAENSKRQLHFAVLQQHIERRAWERP